MQNRHNDDFFNYLIKGMDSKLQAQLNYMYSHARLMDEVNHKKEMEQMEKRITENVMSRIKIIIQTEGLEEIRKLFNDLAKLGG